MAGTIRGLLLVAALGGGGYTALTTASDHLLPGDAIRLLRAAAQPQATTGDPGRFAALRLAAGTGHADHPDLRAAGSRPPSDHAADRAAADARRDAARPVGEIVPTAGRLRVAEAAKGGDPAPATRQPDATSRRLATAIQVELKRVGCYSGDIDGDWGAGSRRAMRAFNARIKAALPVEQPDYILLTLLQGHAGQACGAECPFGEVPARDGQCRPRAAVAEAMRNGAPSEPASWARAIAEAVSPGKPAAPASSATTASLPTTPPPPVQPREAETAAAAEAGRPDRAAAERMAQIEAARTDEARRTAEARADAGKARATAALAAERDRIASIEADRLRRGAEAKARAEAERLARLAAAEKARAEAVARREDELAALARRAAASRAADRPSSGRPTPDRATPDRPRPDQPRTASPVPAPSLAGSATIVTAPLPTPRPPLPPAADTPLLAASEPPPPRRPTTLPHATGATPEPWLPERAAPPAGPSRPDRPRFVARFVPPPSYRVGRLPPSRRLAPPPRQAVVYVRRARRPASIFGHLAHHSP